MNSDIKRYTIETNEITPFYKWIEDNKEVIVIKYKNEIKVFDSICPHFGGRLEFDNKDNAKLVCPFHGIMLFKLKIDCKQYTEFDQQDSWEIAQDMEHIDVLHKKTNYKIIFEEIDVNKNPNINRIYNKIKYSVVRKIFFFLKIKIKGYIEIKNDYEILQNEK